MSFQKISESWQGTHAGLRRRSLLCGRVLSVVNLAATVRSILSVKNVLIPFSAMNPTLRSLPSVIPVVGLDGFVGREISQTRVLIVMRSPVQHVTELAGTAIFMVRRVLNVEE